MSDNKEYTNLSYIKEWLEKNIYTCVDEHLNMLMRKEILTIDDIENFYKSNKEEPQEVYQWLQGSEWAYKVFKAYGIPVVKCNEIYFIGRLCYGQSMEMDFNYNSDKFINLIKSNF
jgi:hypothetical protein